MTEEDHLDKEVSAAAELTPTGVKASARSRFISGLDRLGGNITELLNVPMERRTSMARAKMEGEKKLIAAATEFGIEHMKRDPAFTARALENHFEGLFSKQERKDRVLSHAAQSLELEPPTDAQNGSGAEQLDDAFLSRFERYAEDATSEEVQEKWGRVLAGEVRKPGTFSSKVMRVIDELAPSAAQLFEKLCLHRIGNAVPKALSGELNYNEAVELETSGLIVDPLGGQERLGRILAFSDGVERRAIQFGTFALAFDKDATLIKSDDTTPLILEGTAYNSPIYLLTDVGVSISGILPDTENAALHNYADRLVNGISTGEAFLLDFRDGLGHTPVKQVVKRPEV